MQENGTMMYSKILCINDKTIFFKSMFRYLTPKASCVIQEMKILQYSKLAPPRNMGGGGGMIIAERLLVIATGEKTLCINHLASTHSDFFFPGGGGGGRGTRARDDQGCPASPIRVRSMVNGRFQCRCLDRGYLTLSSSHP